MTARRPLGLVPAVLAVGLLAACGGGGGGGTVPAAPTGKASTGKASTGKASTGKASTGRATSSGKPSSASPLRGLSAAQVLAKAKAAGSAARSVHITARGVTAGRTSAVDLRLVAGKGGTGTIVTGTRQIRITRIGSVAYVSGNDVFFAAIAPGVPGLEGKWLKVSTDDPRLASAVRLTDVAQAMTALLTPTSAITRGRAKAVAGTLAVPLLDSDGDVLYVADKNPAYPLRIDSGKGKGSLVFGEYGAPVRLAAPPAADVLALP